MPAVTLAIATVGVAQGEHQDLDQDREFVVVGEAQGRAVVVAAAAGFEVVGTRARQGGERRSRVRHRVTDDFGREDGGGVEVKDRDRVGCRGNLRGRGSNRQGQGQGLRPQLRHQLPRLEGFRL